MTTHGLAENNTHTHHLTVLRVRSPTWVLRGSNRRARRAAFLLEALGVTRFPCLFQLLEVTCIPWLVAPSPFSKLAEIASSNLSLSFALTSTSILPFPCDVDLPASLLSPWITNTGYSAHPKTLHFIQPANSLLPDKILGTRTWTSLEEPFFCLPKRT